MNPCVPDYPITLTPADTLPDTDLLRIMRDTTRDLRESVRLAAADRIDHYRRQLGQMERIIQEIDPTLRPSSF